MRDMPLLPDRPTWNIDRRPQYRRTIVDDLAPFVSSTWPTARMYHRPRSANLYGTRLCVLAWCGNSLQQPDLHYTAPSGKRLCGGCEGRAVGAGWPASEQVITGRDVDPWPRAQFTPRPYFEVPKWCPGAKLDLYLPDPSNWRIGRCLVCKATVRLRAQGTYLNPKFGPERHEPFDMVPACRLHGWLRLVILGTDPPTVGCRCRSTDPDGFDT